MIYTVVNINFYWYLLQKPLFCHYNLKILRPQVMKNLKILLEKFCESPPRCLLYYLCYVLCTKKGWDIEVWRSKQKKTKLKVQCQTKSSSCLIESLWTIKGITTGTELKHLPNDSVNCLNITGGRYMITIRGWLFWTLYFKETLILYHN